MPPPGMDPDHNVASIDSNNEDNEDNDKDEEGRKGRRQLSDHHGENED